MAKKRVGKFPKAFRQMAVDRLNAVREHRELAKELGISRRLLYTWREKLEPRESSADRLRIRERPRSGKRSANSSGCWRRRCWKWIFSKGPCNKSRRDASGAAQLARRHLRPHPGRDVEARLIEYRADV